MYTTLEIQCETQPLCYTQHHTHRVHQTDPNHRCDSIQFKVLTTWPILVFEYKGFQDKN